MRGSEATENTSSYARYLKMAYAQLESAMASDSADSAYSAATALLKRIQYFLEDPDASEVNLDDQDKVRAKKVKLMLHYLAMHHLNKERSKWPNWPAALNPYSRTEECLSLIRSLLSSSVGTSVELKYRRENLAIAPLLLPLRPEKKLSYLRGYVSGPGIDYTKAYKRQKQEFDKKHSVFSSPFTRMWDMFTTILRPVTTFFSKSQRAKLRKLPQTAESSQTTGVANASAEGTAPTMDELKAYLAVYKIGCSIEKPDEYSEAISAYKKVSAYFAVNGAHKEEFDQLLCSKDFMSFVQEDLQAELIADQSDHSRLECLADNHCINKLGWLSCGPGDSSTLSQQANTLAMTNPNISGVWQAYNLSEIATCLVQPVWIPTDDSGINSLCEARKIIPNEIGTLDPWSVACKREDNKLLSYKRMQALLSRFFDGYSEHRTRYPQKLIIKSPKMFNELVSEMEVILAAPYEIRDPGVLLIDFDDLNKILMHIFKSLLTINTVGGYAGLKYKKCVTQLQELSECELDSTGKEHVRKFVNIMNAVHQNDMALVCDEDTGDTDDNCHDLDIHGRIMLVHIRSMIALSLDESSKEAFIKSLSGMGQTGIITAWPSGMQAEYDKFNQDNQDDNKLANFCMEAYKLCKNSSNPAHFKKLFSDTQPCRKSFFEKVLEYDFRGLRDNEKIPDTNTLAALKFDPAMYMQIPVEQELNELQKRKISIIKDLRGCGRQLPPDFSEDLEALVLSLDTIEKLSYISHPLSDFRQSRITFDQFKEMCDSIKHTYPDVICILYKLKGILEVPAVKSLKEAVDTRVVALGRCHAAVGQTADSTLCDLMSCVTDIRGYLNYLRGELSAMNAAREQQPSQCQSTSLLEVRKRLVSDRGVGVTQLQQSLSYSNNLFRVCAAIVQAQQECIDCIEENTTEAAERSKAALAALGESASLASMLTALSNRIDSFRSNVSPDRCSERSIKARNSYNLFVSYVKAYLMPLLHEVTTCEERIAAAEASAASGEVLLSLLPCHSRGVCASSVTGGPVGSLLPGHDDPRIRQPSLLQLGEENADTAIAAAAAAAAAAASAASGGELALGCPPSPPEGRAVGYAFGSTERATLLPGLGSTPDCKHDDGCEEEHPHSRAEQFSSYSSDGG